MWKTVERMNWLEIMTTIIDHIISYGLLMRECRVLPCSIAMHAVWIDISVDVSKGTGLTRIALQSNELNLLHSDLLDSVHKFHMHKNVTSAFCKRKWNKRQNCACVGMMYSFKTNTFHASLFSSLFLDDILSDWKISYMYICVYIHVICYILGITMVSFCVFWI